jgi:putative NIF3 family GTP cyclohydrolase 1 type 2
MVDTRELIGFLDDLLDPAAFDDRGPNGLQVPGAGEIKRVVTGVTAQRALFERAVAEEAQLVLVHHGLFWSFSPVGLTPLLAERLRPLFKNDIALAAYHLPLDAHPDVGNNALLTAPTQSQTSSLSGRFRVRREGVGREAWYSSG